MTDQVIIISLLILTLVVCFYVAASSFRQSPKNIKNKTFSILVLLISVWTAVSFLEGMVPEWWSIILVHTDFALGPLLAMAFLEFSFSFNVQISRRVFLIIRSLSVVVGGLLVVATFTSAIIKTITFDNGPVVSSGRLYSLYGIYVVSLIILAIVLLIVFYRKSQGIQKLRVRLVLLAMSTSAFMAIISNLIIPRISSDLFMVNTLPRIGSITSLLAFSAISLYAILRHRFLDIRFALRAAAARILSAIIWSGILGLVGVIYTVFYPSANLNLPLAATIVVVVSLLISLTFDQVYDSITAVTNRFLFQQDYDAPELIRDLSKKITETISLPILNETIKSALVTAFKPTFVRLVMGSANADVPMIIHKELQQREDTLVLDELLASDQDLKSDLIKALQDLQAAVVLPLATKKAYLGMIILGEKKNNEAYTSNDLSTLETISYAAGVALENAHLYQESLDFNQKLKAEVHKATVDLQGAYNRLKELDKTKDDFLAIASHELRTPMTNIKNFLWMMGTAKGGDLSDQKKEYLTKAEKSVERMLTLINDMLDVSRIDQNRLELHPIDVDLYKLIPDIIEEFKPRVEAKGLYLKMDVGSQGSDVGNVRADEGKLREVITNLVGNSVKFTTTGGITIKIYPPDKNQIKISIIDTGKGISENNLPKLFHKFSRADNSYTTVAEAGGTGLGLYISKSLVEKMNGTIGVNTKVGQGSDFWFTLPQAL